MCGLPQKVPTFAIAMFCGTILLLANSGAAQTVPGAGIPYPSEPMYGECVGGECLPTMPMGDGCCSLLDCSNFLSPDWRWTFLPQGFLYHTYWASQAEPRLSSQIFGENHEGTLLDSTIGGRVGLVRFGQRYAEEGIQLDVLAGAKLRQDVDHEMDMVGTDYRFDIPLTYRKGSQAWKFGFYHVSSHVGDEYLIQHPGFDRLNYYRNSLYLGYSYYMVPEFRLYGEIDYGFDTDIAKPWNFQFGFDYGPAYATGIRGAPFFAINAHLRQELNYGGNVNMQGGWAWRGEGLASGTLRTGPFFYNGGSPQFSFYANNEQQLGWGLWYDF
ncbi:Protein of unknown function [Planctomicrobium piriforme]|uniref:MetA-pathway of phenol degradation n=2 Tax=Planctomicrobium piriforme TaxID=1576369 RepID=A0A1I3G955_9PLAN|nr:Protein of unknown function [Planctomicrobium piriforme]